MASSVFHHAVNTSWVKGGSGDCTSSKGFQDFNIKSVIVSLQNKNLKCIKQTHMSNVYKLHSIHPLKQSRARPVVFSLHSNGHVSQTTENESSLILIRHGESMWNEKNLFTGCVDVPLTSKGVEEAIEAGKRISNLPLDIIYISALIRSQMTAMLALTEHHSLKVPIIIHEETEQATLWSQIHSDGTRKHCIPVVKAWQLNERMYGELQGLNKQETAERYGKEQVHKWRRSYDVRPPNGESLEMCLGRAVTFFKENIEPHLSSGRHVMVVAHANSLRSIIMYLDKLTPQEVINLELLTGVPMLYIYKDRNFIRRGSPIGSSEAGVYAYTESLALYRQKLDETPDEDPLAL